MQEDTQTRTAGAPVPAFKVAFAGPEAVGKTSLVRRLGGEEFNAQEQHTVGAMFSRVTTVHNVDGGHAVCFEEHLWDTAGQERFAELLPIYARNSDVVVLTFDACGVSRDLVREHVERLSQCSFERQPLLVVALNKVDKLTSVGREGIRIFAQELEELGSAADFEDVAFWGGLRVCETSAKTGEGVDDMHRAIRKTLAPKALLEVRRRHLEVVERNSGCC